MTLPISAGVVARPPARRAQTRLAASTVWQAWSTGPVNGPGTVAGPQQKTVTTEMGATRAPEAGVPSTALPVSHPASCRLAGGAHRRPARVIVPPGVPHASVWVIPFTAGTSTRGGGGAVRLCGVVGPVGARRVGFAVGAGAVGVLVGLGVAGSGSSTPSPGPRSALSTCPSRSNESTVREYGLWIHTRPSWAVTSKELSVPGTDTDLSCRKGSSWRITTSRLV